MSDVLDGTTWTLTGPMPLVDGAEVVVSFQVGSISGTAGCNQMRGSYHLSGGAFHADQLVTTMMACPPPVMALESDVLQRLGAAGAANVVDGSLVLRDREGRLLLTFVPQSDEQLQGEWAVTALHWPEREAIISVDGTLSVSFDGYRVTGHSGVNTFRGTCSIEANALTFGPLMSTRMAGDESAMQQEQAMLAALANTVAYRLVGSRLTLERPDGLISVTLQRVR
ncbi:MAG: META domain-containing protein [Actinomycetota bacterium]|nr:META domain-containing protein [Actinomycetota bacterium]